MKIKLITIGKMDLPFLNDGLDFYLLRLKHYCKLEYIELPHSNLPGEHESKIMQIEAAILYKYFEEADYNILLDETGKSYSSVQFASQINNWNIKGMKNLHFYIGGAYGFHDSIRMKCDAKISVSCMTFTHQMVRLIFVEQLYRAFTILQNEKYHH